MKATCPWLTWVGKVSFVAFVATGAFTGSAFGARSTVLFPKPLHLVRTIEDPLARAASTVHEYCAGNQVITVNGSRVAVADYDKQQLTEIDREAGTYSVTPFAEIATANAFIRGGGRPNSRAAKAAAKPADASAENWKATQLGMRGAVSGRSLDAWQLVRGESRDRTTIEVGVDRRIALSRDALEVLVGASYPNTRREEHDALLRAASGGQEVNRRQPSANSTGTAPAAAQYGLPMEQVMTFESDGERVEVRNTVREVNDELPPPNLLIIPPGSKLVESRAIRMARELRELDELPGQSSRP